MPNPLKVTAGDRYIRVRMTDGSTKRGIVHLNCESEPMRRISDLMSKGNTASCCSVTRPFRARRKGPS